MIILLIIKILIASNFEEESKKHNNKDERITNINLDINQNPCFYDFNHKFIKTPMENNNFNFATFTNSNDLCLQNQDLSEEFSNLKTNIDRIYAPIINFQTKIHADNPTTITSTKQNENSFSFYEEQQSNLYNFYKSINQPSFNQNASSNYHLNFEIQNNHIDHYNHDIVMNKSNQFVSKKKNVEINYDTSKYLQNEEILQDQPLDYSIKKISEFQQSVKNKDLSEIQTNSVFDENNKNLKRYQELNKKLKQNDIQPKRTRINSFNIDSILSDQFIQTNNVITPQSEVINIKSNFSKTIEPLKTDLKLTTSGLKKVANTNLNDKITNYEQNVFYKYQLKYRPILPKNTKETNNTSNIPSTSKTFLSSKNYENILISKNQNNSPYDNDFDSPNFPRDFLNSFITELNKKYLEKCENIFSIVAEKISEVLFRTKCENKILESTKCKNSLTYKCYLKINSSIKIILKEILDEEIPISIHINSFINLNKINLDLIMNMKAEYNIFRTNENENDVINSLINKIENKYKDEAKKTFKSAYNNFLKNLNPFISMLMKNISNGQINNKAELYLNINKIYIYINKYINFANEEITETDRLIIYKVLKSISKFLKRTSEDQYLSQVFPEFRIINILYHLRLNDHHISGRKFHSGIFIKKFLKQKLKDFKEKYQSFEKIDNLDDDYLKEILEIRTFYIFNFFKFINIKKPYLMAYILLSIKSYLLQSQKNNYNEKDEIEKIFSLHVLNLNEILNKQVSIHIQSFYDET
ncbi:hypothetical protein DMUE_1295 [Dictyocoela muelleri]|nr:hypothetical protein DMUE_1295 [Dictyocoela muelleri]